MRFAVGWLDEEGFIVSAAHLEAISRKNALRFLCRHMYDGHTHPGVSGFILKMADSEFILRYTIAPGGQKRIRLDACESDLAFPDFPHLLRKG